jgi:hypothetical protein
MRALRLKYEPRIQEDLKKVASDSTRWRLNPRQAGKVTFPRDSVLQELFAKHLPGIGPLEIVARHESELLIDLPKGTSPETRQSFLKAIESLTS